jgi:6-pyruvoyl-tetrahydropterin synthase
MTTPTKPSKQKTSTIFLNEITCIDHAYFDGNSIMGGSFMASFKVTGSVDPEENVVVDFSTLKKLIKDIIDDRNIGLDHKLWIFPTDWVQKKSELDASNVVFANKYLTIDAPDNAFHILLSEEQPSYSEDYLERYIGSFLTTIISETHYPSVVVECKLTTKPINTFGASKHFAFNYTHGLKNSTSWACTSPVHGHRSFITMDLEPKVSDASSKNLICELLSQAAVALNGGVFINRSNVIASESDERYTTIGYHVPSRGHFKVKYDSLKHKLFFFDEDTTIEHLVETALQKVCVSLSKLKELGVRGILISEGLSKGAYLELPDID